VRHATAGGRKKGLLPRVFSKAALRNTLINTGDLTIYEFAVVSRTARRVIALRIYCVIFG
jgi:hypothetical protein